MLIKIIKKRHVEEARAPAPLIEATPPIKSEAKPAPTELKIAPSPKPGPDIPYEKRPVADTLAEFWANPARYRTRPPTACKLCESIYSYPLRRPQRKMHERPMGERTKENQEMSNDLIEIEEHLKSGSLYDLKPQDYPLMCRAGAAHLAKGAWGLSLQIRH